MQTLTELPNTTLYYREGPSDKVYQCQIEAAGERFVVNFAYGRRGSTLNTGTKTNVPVDYDSAQRIFYKLVKEKMGTQRATITLNPPSLPPVLGRVPTAAPTPKYLARNLGKLRPLKFLLLNTHRFLLLNARRQRQILLVTISFIKASIK